MDTKQFEPLWGNWYLKEPIGAGSFGVVYKAQQTITGHTDICAVKHISIPRDETENLAVMGQLSTRDPEILNSFYEQTAESIISEYYVQKEFAGKGHIVQVYDIMTIPKTDMPGLDLFIRMELLNGIDVRFKKGMSREEKEKEVIRLGKDICIALREMHGKHYLHRDIKPQNILVTDDGSYKLADFGMARELHSSASYMSMKGTMDYIAPEVMTGSKVGFSSDLYSLGLVLYQLLDHLELPFQSNDTGHGDYNARRLSGEIFPLPAEASPEMAKVILKACAYRPEERFENVNGMYSALEKLTSFSNAMEFSVSESTRDALYIKVLQMMLEAGNDSEQWEHIMQFLKKPELDHYRDTDNLRIKAQQRYAECMPVEHLVNNTPEQASIKKEPAVGEYVLFGKYRQNATIDGTSPIEWQVLEIKSGKALLLSKYGLDSRVYNDQYGPITWENCTLRKWLNETFLNTAFTETEKRAIPKALVDNSRSQGYNGYDTNGGNTTEDWIFLLSYAEANRYLGVTEWDDKNIKSRVSPTAYAKLCGAYETRKKRTSEDEATGWWWLRSPGGSQSYAARVRDCGALDDKYVFDNSGCVRPALWVNLESGIFYFMNPSE